MCTLGGKSERVVDADGFTIDELAGNVSTKSDRISIACVSAAAGTKEPWLTLHYDEWICVRKGLVRLTTEEGSVDVKASTQPLFVVPVWALACVLLLFQWKSD